MPLLLASAICKNDDNFFYQEFMRKEINQRFKIFSNNNLKHSH